MAAAKNKLLHALALLSFSFPPVFAGDLSVSGNNEITENPFIAYGVNPVTKVVSGFLLGLRASPERTDACRFAFAGSLKNPSAFTVKYLSEVDGYEKSGSTSSAVVKNVDGNLLITVKKDQMGGDCEWILPFINEPRVKELRGEVAVRFGKLNQGDWIGVFAIKSERARFYRSADEASPQAAYLIQGDFIYVYAEQQDWYYVKYERRKKTTEGWIKKSDTVQLRLSEK
jgi:hypothetical protein